MKSHLMTETFVIWHSGQCRAQRAKCSAATEVRKCLKKPPESNSIPAQALDNERAAEIFVLERHRETGREWLSRTHAPKRHTAHVFPRM